MREEEEVGQMHKSLRRLQKARALVLGTATLTLLWFPVSAHAQATATQSAATQDRQAAPEPMPGDDITRRDLARFDQFLDNHRDIAEELRRTPSLIDDPQYLERHPELNTYLQDHPSVKEEISAHPDTFMRLEDTWARDAGQRDRDAGGQDRGANQRAAVDFDRFLDQHREISEQVRRDPSLCDNSKFVDSHPALQTYLQDHPEVRDQLRQDPNAFMRLADVDNRDLNRDAGMQSNDAYRRDVNRDAMNFNRFLDDHREIGEQVRKDPSLLDDRTFVDSHPALQAYLQDNPGVRDQLRQDPNAFMRQADFDNRDLNAENHDPMHDHMADFGGFLGSHPDIQKDLSRDPSCVRDHQYMQDHAELDAYLTAHPDVRSDLMANPQDFVHGAQQYNSGSATGAGAGVNGRGTASSGTTGTSTNSTTTTHVSKPNQ
jgi:hypothetical protein